MLDYCTRFYERQFITREDKNETILTRFEQLSQTYITSGKLQGGRQPSSAYFATQLNLSTAYFNDLLRFETGKTLQEYIQLKQLDIAKQMLLKSGQSPSVIARQLGFASVQYFSSLFKKITGCTPNEYKYSQN